jgi:UPF0755 protein
MKKLRIFFFLLSLVVLAFSMFFQEGSLPVDRKNQGIEIFSVRKGEGLNAIVKNLSKQNLIRNKIVFYLIVKRLGIEKNMQAGDFRLSKSMSAEEIAQSLTHGTSDVWVTIIEGLRKEEIAQILTENFKIPSVPFIEQAREGYLFPDTYLIPKDATIEKILSIFTMNFEKKYSSELRNKIKALELTEREGLILASLVEKEAKFPEDKRKVAGILYKRFKTDWMMQIDATIQYALRYQKKEKTWWKKDLTIDDIDVDSTYNTYKYKGLPPAPICNPGLDSLIAVANADVHTKYWYYISDNKGNMHYAATLEEHNENIRKYL